MARFRIDTDGDEPEPERPQSPLTTSPNTERQRESLPPKIENGGAPTQEPETSESEASESEASESDAPEPDSATLLRNPFVLLVGAILLLEVALRLMGVPDAGFRDTGMLEVDPILGWRDPTQSVPTKPGVLLLGEAEYGTEIRNQVENLALNDIGAVGYGTHQSLLALERLLSGEGPAPLLIVYLLRESHEARNVAAKSWLYRVSRLPALGTPSLPFVTFDGRGLSRHEPVSAETWPLRRFALVALAEREVLTRGRYAREDVAREATEGVIEEMSALARRNLAAFRVIVLEGSLETREHYDRFLRANDIEHTDCVGAETASCIALYITR